MVSVSYSHRIIVDCNFVRWISTSLDKKSTIISKMLRININSKEHPKENILISDMDFDKLCTENVIKDKDMIRGCMFPFNIDKKIEGVNKERLPEELIRLVMGVILTTEEPYQVILLTTKNGKEEYLSKYSDFLKQLRNFDVKDEEESLVILNDLYKKYVSEREISR